MTNFFFKPLCNLDNESIILENINYRIGNFRFKDFCLKLSANQISALIGPNGSGKTLCLKIIAGLIKPKKGKINILKRNNYRIGYVSQKTVMLRRSVYENLKFALKIYKFSNLEIKIRISKISKLMKIEHIIADSARTLSSGEQQLISILRSIIIRPNILLLDEPFSNLDQKSIKKVEKILELCSKEGIKIIFVTHDAKQIKRFAKEVVFLNKGKVEEQGKTTSFFKSSNNSNKSNALKYLNGELID